MTRLLHRAANAIMPVAVGGKGIELIDSNGKRYIDASGGAAVSCLGHGHPDVIAALHRQLDTLAYAHTGFFTSEAAERLADRLVEDAPAGLDRFDGIFDHVAKRLPKLPAIADHVEFAFQRLQTETDPRMRDLMKEERLTRDFVDILVPEHWFRHPSEVREFVDHATQVTDLADDRAGQTFECFGIRGNFLSEPALEPLRRKLNRSQRILDFVRDAAGNV